MAKKKRRRGPVEAPQDIPKKPVTRELLDRIEQWAQEAVDVYKLLLFDVEVSPRWLIEVTIDQEDGGVPGQGVTIDQCVQVSSYMEALLDTDDEIPETYTLEVSSPGVERELSKPRHFSHVVGRTVRLVLSAPCEGQNVFEGTLASFDDPHLTLEHEGKTYAFEFSQLAKARLTFDFSGVTEG